MMNVVINYEVSQLRLHKCVFFPNPAYRPPEKPGPVATRLALDNRGTFSPARDSVEFTQSFSTGNGPELPFFLEVEFLALFNLSQPAPPEAFDHLVNRIFPPAVFPFMREFIAETTRRGGYPPLLLNPASASDPRAMATYNRQAI